MARNGGLSARSMKLSQASGPGQHRQHQEVQVQVGDKAEPGRPVDEERHAAEADIDTLGFFRLAADGHDRRVVAVLLRHVAQVAAGAGVPGLGPSRLVTDAVGLEQDLDGVARAGPGRLLDLPATRLRVARSLGCSAGPDLVEQRGAHGHRDRVLLLLLHAVGAIAMPQQSWSMSAALSPGTRAKRSMAGRPIPWERRWQGA